MNPVDVLRRFDGWSHWAGLPWKLTAGGSCPDDSKEALINSQSDNASIMV
ncbi:hypothetical protein [Dialister sp.]|nr:hypothetical protein [Dialister sp.]